tara:strand:+ start:36 stop:557 length:522 start_codon:yes stop_codon:yes gene_type:complete
MILKQIENFIPRLDGILPELRKIKLYSVQEINSINNVNETWPGLRSKHLFSENRILFEFINNILFKNNNVFEKGGYTIDMFLHLRLAQDEKKDWIHTDDAHDYSGIIYLSDTNLNSGTQLFDNEDNVINDMKCVQNRAIFFSSNYNHKAYGHFGSNVQDGRLTLNLFIKKHGT